jgi:hypothetical protein
MRRHRAAAAAAAVLALAACSGGNDAADTTVAAAPTVSVDTSTTASSAPSPTITSTSTTTTTTIPATTTIPPDPEQAVADALILYHSNYVSCLRAPAQCDPTTFAADPSEAVTNLNRTLGELQALGSYAGPEDAGTPIVQSVALGPDGTTATARFCLYDTGVLYGPPGPDGQPVPIANTPTSFVFDYDLVLQAEWLVTRANLLDRQAEVNLCGE